MDGRIDNHTELRRALETKGYRLRIGTDAEVILRAYECWGAECPERILGDFAFAIWDSRERQVFYARDTMGLLSFYYHDGRRFLLASELHQILEDSAVSRRPNEGFIGECLAGADPPLDQTLFTDILQLPRAH